MRSPVSGAVFKRVCVFLQKRGEGGTGEVHFHVVRDRKDGTGFGQGPDPTGKAWKRAPERTAKVSRLRHNTAARKVARLQSDEIFVARYNQ